MRRVPSGAAAARRRRAAGPAMIAVSHVATPPPAGPGRAALLEAVGRVPRRVTLERSRPILHRVAGAPGTSARHAGRDRPAAAPDARHPGAQRVVDQFARNGDGRTPSSATCCRRVSTWPWRATRRPRGAAQPGRGAGTRPQGAPGAAGPGDRRARRARPRVAPIRAGALAPHRPVPGSSAAGGLQRRSPAPVRLLPSGPRASAMRSAECRPDAARRGPAPGGASSGGVRPPDAWTVGDVRLCADRHQASRTAERPDQVGCHERPGLASIVEQHGISVLHPATPWPNLQVASRSGSGTGSRSCTRCAASARRPGYPSHLSWPRRAPTTRWSRPSRPRSCSQADAIVTLSDGMRDRLVERGIPAERRDRHHQRRRRRAVHAPGPGRRTRPAAGPRRRPGHRLHLDPRACSRASRRSSRRPPSSGAAAAGCAA